MDRNFNGQVALITGGAQGFGAAIARRLAALGAKVVIADINEELGSAVAEEVGGIFIVCDVTDYTDNQRAVACAVDNFGGLDMVLLNAGVVSALRMGDDFDEVRYRKVMGINLDGVVFGFNAALPALRQRGGGDVIATASMAGLTPVPFDPVYSANKAAVVGLTRSLGEAHAHENVRVNAVCPAFADTAIVDDIREGLAQAGVPLLTVDEVVDVFMQILDSGQNAQCWFVQPGRASEPFEFRRAPGPRTDQGGKAPAGDAETQRRIADSLVNPKD
ncbi:MAG: SDR family NAD(P)-dependent oxidoreductase [Candidatus Nanopelagicales bacterium]